MHKAAALVGLAAFAVSAGFSLVLENSLQTAVILLGISFFVVAAYGDIRTRRIPNALAASVAVLGITRLIEIGDPIGAAFTIGSAALVSLPMFALFTRSIVGGGDVKLLTASVLLIGYHDLFSFLILMSLAGALVSLLVITLHSPLPFFLGPRLATLVVPKSRSVPYGVAIAAGAVVTLFLQSSLIG